MKQKPSIQSTAKPNQTLAINDWFAYIHRSATGATGTEQAQKQYDNLFANNFKQGK